MGIEKKKKNYMKMFRKDESLAYEKIKKLIVLRSFKLGNNFKLHFLFKERN